jgi:plastocyanin
VFASLLAIAASLALASTGTASDEARVQIVFRAYDPVAMTVAAGQVVTWQNTSTSAHTVTALAGAFDSGRLEPSASFSYTFTTPGNYAYTCKIHPSMKGDVLVLAPGERHAGAVVVRLVRKRRARATTTAVTVRAPWPGALALVQLARSPGSAWTTVRRVSLNAAGTASVSLGSARGKLRVLVQAVGGTPQLTSATYAIR